MVNFHFTLFDFQGKVIGYKDYACDKCEAAIARGGKLLWYINNCARVIIEDDYGFNVTIVWGARRDS